MGFFGGGGTTPVNMVGASTGTAGTAGYVPAPAAGKNTRYLSSDASFGEVPMLPKRKDTSSNFKWYSPAYLLQNTASSNPSTRVRIFTIGYFPEDGDINTLGLRIVVAPASTVNIHLAAWECGEDGLPSTYITGGTIASGTTGNTDLSLSVAQASVKRGFCFFSATYETGSGSCQGYSPSNSTLSGGLYGKQNNLNGNGGNPIYTATTYDQTTHGTFTFNATGNHPVVGYKYV